MRMNIIYEDKDKMIINKEAGQLVQSGKGFDTDLVSEVLNYRKKKGEATYAAVINRLDRPVSGVVLMAKNKAAAAKYSQVMQQQGFCKEYFAIVYGKMEEKQAVLTDYLLKMKENTAKICSEAENGAKYAELEYEVVREISLKNEALGADEDANDTVSYVRIVLHTGRFHQIRAQFASRGHAVLGDSKYSSLYGVNIGDDIKETFKIPLAPHEIALCAHALTVDKRVYTVTPSWWETQGKP
jgi:23S rRNA pseudouridine1911/1915/1917 synthase